MKKIMLLAFLPGYSRICFLFVFFFLITVGLNAQTVKGTAKDGESKPVAGATGSVKGTSKATSTNSAGNFSINTTGDDIIVVNYIGFVRRLSYPDLEAFANTANYNAAAAAIGGDKLTSRVFWDTP